MNLRGVALGALAVGLLPQPARDPVLPAPLDSYLNGYVKLQPAQRRELLAGNPVTTLLPANSSQEVAVLGAMWIDALPDTYVQQMKDIETFEQGGGFRVTRRISDPPRLSDFDDMELPRDDVADLKNCRVGSCAIKLGQDALDRMRTQINWSSPTAVADATALARRLSLEYVTGYLQGGNAELAIYRDGARPTFVADEFKSMVDRIPSMVAYLPELRTYLLDFPKATLANSTSFLYWQEAQFGLKPTIRINHVVIQERADATVVASKQIYATHYFWTALEIRVLLPDPPRGNGFWLVDISRSRSDGLTGFVGGFVRRRVESEAQKGILAMLQNIKTKLP